VGERPDRSRGRVVPGVNPCSERVLAAIRSGSGRHGSEGVAFSSMLHDSILGPFGGFSRAAELEERQRLAVLSAKGEEFRGLLSRSPTLTSPGRTREATETGTAGRPHERGGDPTSPEVCRPLQPGRRTTRHSL
jgi:hypothetical protein